MQNELSVRAVKLKDVPALCDLLNAIVVQGGTTAQRETMSAEEFAAKYLHASDLISCLVAEAKNGELRGFQVLKHQPYVPDDWGDIATFARIGNTAKGVGSQLFQSTLKLAQDKGLVAINATIRSYNTGGLKFYGKMGFVEYKRTEAEPLEDGAPAEMIFKKRTV